jgi:hypothetical protein
MEEDDGRGEMRSTAQARWLDRYPRRGARFHGHDFAWATRSRSGFCTTRSCVLYCETRLLHPTLDADPVVLCSLQQLLGQTRLMVKHFTTRRLDRFDAPLVRGHLDGE